jgi:hypothetical protein
MDLLQKRNQLSQSYSNIQQQIAEMEAKHTEMVNAKMRIEGALLLCDELLAGQEAANSENSEQQKSPVPQ